MLNVDAEFGDVRVAVLNEHGGALEGFGHDEAVPIERDAIEAQVCWDTGDSLGALRGRRVRLHVHGGAGQRVRLQVRLVADCRPTRML